MFSFQSGWSSKEVRVGFSGCRRAFNLIRLGMCSERAGWVYLGPKSLPWLGVIPGKWAEGHSPGQVMRSGRRNYVGRSCSSSPTPTVFQELTWDLQWIHGYCRPHNSCILQATLMRLCRAHFCDTAGNSSKKGWNKCPSQFYPVILLFGSLCTRIYYLKHYVKTVYMLGNAVFNKMCFLWFLCGH